MKMFPGTLISRLKQMLTGGSGGSTDSNDRKRKSAVLQNIDAKKRRMTTLSSIPAPVEQEEVVSNNINHSLLQSDVQTQNGVHGSFTSSMSKARRLSEITDMPQVVNHHAPYAAPTFGSIQHQRTLSPVGGRGSIFNAASSSNNGSNRFCAPELRPLGRRNNSGPPPNLIPIKFVTARPSIGGGQRNNSTRLFAGSGSGGLFRRSEHNTPASSIPRTSEVTSGEAGNVSLLTNGFRDLLRSKYSTTPSTGSDGTAALDRELKAQREALKKYEALMRKFIPITNDPPAKGAYERYTRRTTVNGGVKVNPIETYELTDDEVEAEEDEVQLVSDTSDDCAEASAASKSGRLFTTIDPLQLSAAQEREDEQQQQQQSLEPVNSVRERFETKHVFRDDIIHDVQQRYGTLFSQRKSLIEQEKNRLGSLRQNTHVQENEARNKMLNYVCSFYKFDVLNESELKESTPEPEEVPLPELTKEQLDEMHRKLRAGNQVVMEKFNLRITGNDLVTLQDLNWLNDAVINFYMELLRERSELKRDQGLPKVYTMNTFFLPQLLRMGYSGVRRWTRKVDLLAHDVIVVPVHVGGIHWCMSTIDLRHKTIHYYDSMGSPNNAVLNALEQYLCEESLDKRKTPFDKSGLTKQNMRDCPRQKNGSDCGVFSCMFAEFLTRDHAITFDQSNMPYFRKKMTVEIMLGKLLT
uniref:Ubiquitin-like protease family profile domain-containing protein n=1 Tax=Anopheles epiroticus TaxID=199890 RepID=A0A182P6Y7_9DIPT